MAITTGPPCSAFSGSQQIGTVAQCTGNREIAGGFVAVGCGTAPGGIGVGRILRVAVFTSIGQITHRDIKARIASGTAVRGRCMTFLTVAQIGFGLRPVQSRAGKRKRMRGARSN